MDNETLQQTITDYYSQLAAAYDNDRFGNPYGQYLHRQEKAALLQMVQSWQPPIISLGCGTGRMMELATHGADISSAMIDRAKEKHPDKDFAVCAATATPYGDGCFAGAFCLHVLMHLPVDTIAELAAEAHRIIRPGGWLAIDVANAARRRLANRKQVGWHANTSFSIHEIEQLMALKGWRLRHYRGLLLFPIHRLPNWMRAWCYPIDTWLCRGPLKKFASYYLLLLQKQ